MHKRNALKRSYGNIAGTYRRTDIGQDNTVQSTFKTRNIGLEIVFVYREDNVFDLTVNYWEGTAVAEGIIEFNESHKQYGEGIYRYIKGEPFVSQSDTGKYMITCLTPTKLLAQYVKVFPRELEFNVEANRGWEIWEK